MSRRLLLGALLVPAILVPAGTASAADATVQAVDGTSANSFTNSWAPPNVSIEVGDTVTWEFDGTQVAHNVAPNSSNWNMPASPIQVDGPPVSFTFTDPGTYAFICQIHPEMTGNVLVATAGGEPPPPPDETGPEPFPNPTTAPDVLLRSDDERPRLRRVRAHGVRRGVRVRFRLSERALVTFKVRRGKRKEIRRRVFDAGSHRLTIRDRRKLRRGRVVVQVRARDYAGNRSAWKRDRTRIGR